MWLRTERTEGPFCRHCGLARFRGLTDRTLAYGWIGPVAVLAAVVALVANAGALVRIRRLDRPHHVPGRITPFPAPLAPGAPLVARTGVRLLAVALLAAAVALSCL